MKKLYYLGLLLFVSLLLSFKNEVKASHAMGIDLSYRHLFGDTYEITCTFYRDCAGISAPASMTLWINSPSACGAATSIVLNQAAGSGVEVSPLCASQITNSTCNGGTIPGVQQYTYTNTYTFPSKCTDWNLSINECCRNSTITNLVSPDFWDLYVEATLDNTGTLNNNSPQFTSLPVPYICDGQLFNYNHGTFDPDGDSLVYSLVIPQDGPFPGSNLSHVAPATATYPIIDTRGFNTFNSFTGSMQVIPNGLQVAVITVLVEEYRNGVLIGSTMRDLQVVVQSCTNSQPQSPTNGITNIINGLLVDSLTVETCANSPVSFDVLFQDNNGDNITFTTNIASTIPSASWSETGTVTAMGVSSNTGSFSWAPTSADIGNHFFTVLIQDDGCPILGSQVFTYNIDVVDRTYASPASQTYCAGSPSVDLVANGGTTFTWSVLSGDAGSLTCNPCATQNVSPTSTTQYVVTSDINGICINKDTVTVLFDPSFTLSTTTNQTICYGNNINLNTTPSVGGTYTYAWSPSASLSNGTISNPVASPTTSTTYQVDVVKNNGCSMQDAVTIDVAGTPITASIDKTLICPGETVQLAVGSTPTNCGPNPSGCTGTNTNIDIGSGASSSDIYGPFYDCWQDYRMQALYEASELTAAGMGPSTINEIAFNVASFDLNGPYTYNGFSVKIGCTSSTSLSSSFLSVTDVAYSAASYTPSSGAGWKTITLTNPYDWDGTSNLVVEICWDNSAYDCSSGGAVYYHTTATTKYLYDYTDGASGCSINSPTSSTNRPNIRFVSCTSNLPGGATFSWSGSVDSPSTQTTTATPTSATTYNVTVTDPLLPGCPSTASVSVDIDSTVYLDAQSDDYDVCVGETANLLASMTGSPLPSSIPCGTNGTTMGTTTNYILGPIAGDGTGTTVTPLYGFYEDRKVQYLIRASELTALGMTSGTIDALSIFVGIVASTQSYSGFTIRMGCTTDNSLSTGTGWVATTQVYTNNNFNPVNTSWNNFLLSNRYDWDGVSNLVIEMCFNNTSYTSSDPVRYQIVGWPCTMTAHTDASTGCTLSPSTTYSDRPIMRFRHSPAPPNPFVYSWSPSTGLSSTSVANPVFTNPGGTSYTYLCTVTGGLCTVTDTVTIVCTLPLEFFSFNAVKNNNFVDLSWKNSNDEDIDYYIVERSHNQHDFLEIAEISSVQYNKKTYVYTDNKPFIGDNFYRIKAISHSGQELMSEIKKLEEAQDIRVYPNPIETGKELIIDFYSLNNETTIEISEISGKIVFNQRYSNNDGFNSLKVNTNQLAKGIYIYKIVIGERVEIGKIILE